MIETAPIHFAPILKSVIWGGDKIATFKNIETTQTSIGESWEISAVPGANSVVDRGRYEGLTLTELVEKFGAELVGGPVYEKYGNLFPLLVKIIDAQADLSVQVHPDDALAEARHGCKGKTEMWHIIDTAPGAKIYAGLAEALSPDSYERRVADNTIMDAIAAYDSAPGQTYFLPAGRIHAIGAGNLLAEIQQTSDITYRIYDYDRRDAQGNPRELHTEQARDAIDYTVLPDYRTSPKEGGALVECDYFDVFRTEVSSGETAAIPYTRESFTILMCLGGEATILHPDGTTLVMRRGDTLLYPAVVKGLQAVTNEERAILLSAQA